MYYSYLYILNCAPNYYGLYYIINEKTSYDIPHEKILATPHCY